MTETTMDLRELLEKTADTNFLREMIGYTAQRLMGLEVETPTGAAHGSRNADRLTRRNGSVGASGTPAPEQLSCVSRESARAVTSPASSSRGGWARRR